LSGRIHCQKQEWDAAADALTESLSRYQACHNPQGEAEGSYELGLMYSALPDSEKAHQFLMRSRALYQRLGANNEIARVDTALNALAN
ncbi:MAG: tetratricopeptide repeat protein, partial [Candidatus Poribacteria bacterium]|nr:tetratricopeptide repeat protein [Candidatus Poribacteria bacterium]